MPLAPQVTALLTNRKGTLVKEFSQTEYIQQEHPDLPAIETGACSALSAIWVARRAQGKDYFKYIDSDVGQSEVVTLQNKSNTAYDIMIQQVREVEALGKKATSVSGQFATGLGALLQGKNPKAAVNEVKNKSQERAALMSQDVKALNDIRWRIDAVEKMTGGSLKGESHTYKGAEIARGIQENLNKQGYAIFNFTNAKGHGHATALYSDPAGGVRFFDPNFGEVYFPDVDDCALFLEEMPSALYPRMGPIERVKFQTFACPVFPKCPEDFDKPDKSVAPLNATFVDNMAAKATDAGADGTAEPQKMDRTQLRAALKAFYSDDSSSSSTSSTSDPQPEPSTNSTSP